MPFPWGVVRRILTRVVASLPCALLIGCATPPAPPVSVDQSPPLLQPLPNHALEPKTTGTVAPRPVLSATARGFGEYDPALQSSIFLCAGTGPAFGPCLAVLGGMFAVAGATSSLVYGVVEDDENRAATAQTTASFAELPTIAALSPRIAGAAAARAGSEGRSLVVTDQSCAAPAADFAPLATFELDIAALELEFTPGYQFRLTLVARVTERSCADGVQLRSQRLAYLGPVTTLSKDPARAAQTFTLALDAAVVALGPEVDLYLQGKRGPIMP